MPLYKFACTGCGSTASEYFPIQTGPENHPHQGCGMYLRVWTVPALKKPFQERFNHSVGRVVRSDKDFDEALKRGAEQASLRDGQDHTFTRVDPGDPKAAGVTDAGLESQAKAHRDLGWSRPSSKIIL